MRRGPVESKSPRSLIAFLDVVVLCGFISSWSTGLPAQENLLTRIEKLFAGRDEVENLKEAIILLENSLARDPSNYEMLWRLAKYKYYLSDRQKDEAGKLKLLKDGIEAAKKAVNLESQRPEGHFWLAANSGSRAELEGPFKSLWLIKTIRGEFEWALRLDPAYENGGGYLALGEMEIRLPRLLGGSDRRGLALLENGLKVGPTNSDLKLFLGETYARIGRKEDGKRLLESVINLADPARTATEQEELRSKARRLLDNMR
ncbi:MAG: hypothetical protein DMG06_14165 [Acidobacteria bacterium]|nr:MAG: hypothetical protein DMG06_14165 [Acidobacteriota bacterium]